MRWLLDGYNVIRRDPELAGREEREGLDAGRRALLAVAARLARLTGDDVTVVFDGARRGGDAGRASGGQVQTLFSVPPATADDELRRLAASLRERAIVVSDDRAVALAARRAGTAVVPVGRLLDALDALGRAEREPDLEDKDDDEEVEERGRDRRGNPRRPSAETRATERALARLWRHQER